MIIKQSQLWYRNHPWNTTELCLIFKQLHRSVQSILMLHQTVQLSSWQCFLQRVGIQSVTVFQGHLHRLAQVLRYDGQSNAPEQLSRSGFRQCVKIEWYHPLVGVYPFFQNWIVIHTHTPKGNHETRWYKVCVWCLQKRKGNAFQNAPIDVVLVILW